MTPEQESQVKALLRQMCSESWPEYEDTVDVLADYLEDIVDRRSKMLRRLNPNLTVDKGTGARNDRDRYTKKFQVLGFFPEYGQGVSRVTGDIWQLIELVDAGHQLGGYPVKYKRVTEEIPIHTSDDNWTYRTK